jgi:hypothetical protein
LIFFSIRRDAGARCGRLSIPAQGNLKMPIDTITINSLTRVLSDADLSDEQREKLIRALSAKAAKAGDRIAAAADAPEMTTLTGAISAADSAKVDRKRIPILNEIKARLRRAGYALRDDETVDAVRLDQVLASANVGLDDRFVIKAMLRNCQMLARVA